MSQLFASGGKYCSFSFSISPSNEYSGLISFQMDWLDLLAVKGTQESSPTPQFKSIIFLYSPTLTYIHDYWKNHSFDWWTFTGKVTSLLFNMLSRLVITSLPRSKHFMAAVTICSDFRAQKIKVCHCFPIYLPWCDEAIGPDAILVFWMLSFQPTFSLSSRGSLVLLHFLP